MNRVWSLYIIFLMSLGYGQFLRKVLSDTGGFSSRYSAAILVTLLAVLLVLKFREIALGKLWMWKAFFMALSFACAMMTLFSVYLGATGVFGAAGMVLIGVIVLLPALQQLFLYSYRSPAIWKAAAKE